MSDKKDFPHPEPPYKYKPFTRRVLAVENYLEKKLKKPFLRYSFCYCGVCTWYYTRLSSVNAFAYCFQL